jgi:signal transduction histidine kinase
MALLFAAYLLASQVFSHVYGSVPTSPALIWPASGIALGGLLLGGIALWPAIALGALVHQLLGGSTILVALGLAGANALQPVAGAWLLRRFGFRNTFSKAPDTLMFVLLALFVTVIVPALGTFTFTIAERMMPRGLMGTFIPWWIGQIVSVLIVTPLLIKWLPRFSFRRTKGDLVEAWVAILAVVGTGLLLYWTPYREIAQVPLVYLILIPLLWIALRIGPRFMTLALFLNAALALGGTLFLGIRAGDVATLGYELVQTEIFVIMLSLIFLVLVSIAEERKDTANDLRENVRRLEDAIERIRKEDEAKSRFIATLAHELRNPLAPLMSSLEIMKLERPEAARAGELAEGMTDHLKTMRHLLDDLLDISRISREKLSLQKEHIDLQSVLGRSQRTVAPLMESRGHVLSMDMPDEAIRLEADPVRLEQAFVNLLNNAAKYTEPGGAITLVARTEGDEAVITVADNGIGMDAELLEHVFEPFFQIEQPGKMHAGLGIGLSLTRNLIQMHDGSIEAASGGSGRGSLFTVRIPLPSEGAVAAKAEGAVRTESLAEGFRILIVDDNRAAADALSKLLSLRGNVTETAYTGEDAIAQAPVFRPEVILLDIGLPDMEGYDVARAIRADDSVSATLIALTGYGQESDIKKASKAGFDHHLTKPAGLAEIEEVLATIERA